MFYPSFQSLKPPERGASQLLPGIEPTGVPSMAVVVGSGQVLASTGSLVKVCPVDELRIAAPEIRRIEARRSDEGMVGPPRNFVKELDEWDPWPAGLSWDPSLIVLTPRRNQDGTLILGHFYRYWRPETLAVRVGECLFERDRDFVFNEDWGLIANLDGRLGTPGSREIMVEASIEVALPRLDLVQCGPDGIPCVKQGDSVFVCPKLPSPDPGHVPLAGIFVAPWRAARSPFMTEGERVPWTRSEYAVTAHDIFPLVPCARPEPLGPEALAGSLARLEVGGELRIAFLGDSITLGAEAPLWPKRVPYSATDQTWRGRVIYQLRERYRDATIEPIEAFKGGVPVAYGLETFASLVAPMRPHLVIIAFGANDMDGPVGADATTPLPLFEQQLKQLVARCQSLGAEVLLVSCFPLNPWLRGGAGRRQPAYTEAVRQIAEERNVAYAPVFEAFQQMPMKGFPTYTRLHNWINHPDEVGHALYADTVLDVLARAGVAGTA